MSNLEIVLLAAVFAIAGVRLYKKYVKKDDGTTRPAAGSKNSTSFPSHPYEEEYEPYSKK